MDMPAAADASLLSKIEGNDKLEQCFPT